jgi:hypothetical protein
MVIGGLVPQPGVATRYRAAMELLRYRADQLGEPPPVVKPGHGGH